MKKIPFVKRVRKKGSGNATDTASKETTVQETVNEEKSVRAIDDEDENMYDISLTPKEQSGKKKQKRQQNTYSIDTVSGVDPFNWATVYLLHNDRNEIAKILGRKKNSDGSYVGMRHKMSMLDLRIFTVQFPDESEKDMAYNILVNTFFASRQ